MSNTVRAGNTARGWNDPPEFLHSVDPSNDIYHIFKIQSAASVLLLLFKLIIFLVGEKTK